MSVFIVKSVPSFVASVTVGKNNLPQELIVVILARFCSGLRHHFLTLNFLNQLIDHDLFQISTDSEGRSEAHVDS